MIEPLRNLVQATSMLMTCVIVSVFVPPELIAPSNRTHIHVPPQYDWHHFPAAVTPYIDETTTSSVHVDPVTGAVIEESKGGWFDWLNQPSTEPEQVAEPTQPEQLPSDDKGSWGFWGKTEENPAEPTPEEPTDTGSSWWGSTQTEEEPKPAEPEPQGSWWSTPEEPTKVDDDILPEPVVVPEPVYYEPPKPTPVSDEYPPEDFVARTIWTANMIYSKPELAWFRMTIDVVSLLVCVVLWYMCRSPKPEVNEELKRENEELQEQMRTSEEAHTKETENLEYKNELSEIQREEDQKGEEVPRQGAPDVQKPPAQVTQSAEATQPDTLSSAASVSKKPIPKAEDIEAILKAEEEELLANKQRLAEQARKAQEEEKQRAAAAAEKRRQEEEARRQEEARQAEEARQQEEARRAEAERQRQAEQEKQRLAAEQEKQRQAAEQEKQRLAAEQEKQRLAAEQARKAQEEEEARRQEEARQAEEARLQEEARQQEEARKAEEERQRIAAEQEKQRLAAEQEKQRQAEQEKQRLAAEQEKQRLAAAEQEEKLRSAPATNTAPTLPQQDSAPAPRVVAVGMKAKVREHVGTIRFVGPTQFAAGEWVGVEFDVPVGKNDGTMQGVNYFGPIKPNHGLFIRKEVVQLVD